MIKIYYQGDQDDLLSDCAGKMSQLVRTDGLYKQASSSCFPASVISENAPDKDHFMLHVVAMGAHPHYMPNRNGDAFTRDSLLRTHDTFVKYAKFFREHNNTDADNNLGFVKASAYNKDLDRVELLVHGHKKRAEEEYEMAKAGKELSVSMACFPAGTRVMLPDGTDKSIETVKEGDHVLTHKGNVGVVGKTMHREYTGKMVSIRAWGLPDELVSTENHPIWARVSLRQDSPCPVCGCKFKSLRAHLGQKKDPQHQAVFQDFARATEGFWPAHYLTPKDYVRTGVSAVTNDQGNESLAKLVGYYLSEGSLTSVKQHHVLKGGSRSEYTRYRTEWTFGIGELEMASEVAECLLELGYTNKLPTIFKDQKQHKLRVFSHSPVLFNWLLENCGKYSYGKALSRELMEWKPELQKIILGKWLDGDGHWSNTHRIIGGTTVSRAMAQQLVIIAARCGMAASLTSHQSSPEKICGNKRKSTRRRTYTVKIFDEASIQKLSGVMTKIPENRVPKLTSWTKSVGHLKHQEAGQTTVMQVSGKTRVFVENGYIYRCIRLFKETFTTETVYDLHVPGDHGFHANGVGVSNCKLPYDECSCCGNHARHTDHYCDHLKDSMNQYLPEFRKYAFAFNPSPKFFDISRVKRPADRIAHYLEYVFGDEQDSLQKAASEVSRGGIVIPGAAWAAYEGFTDTEVPELSETFLKLATDLKGREDWFHTVANLDTLDPDKAYVFGVVKNATVTDKQGLSETLMDLQPGVLFNKLANSNTVLPYDLFCSYVEGKPLAEIHKDPDFIKSSSQLPFLFNNLLKTASKVDITTLLDTFAPASEYFCSSIVTSDPRAIEREVDELERNYSVKMAAVRDRALNQPYSQTSGIRKQSFARDNEYELGKLDTAYACYQLQTLIHSDASDIEYLGTIGSNTFNVKKD